MKICHIITGLSVGGAEMMLLKLLHYKSSPGLDHHVLCLRPEGPVADVIRSKGFEVQSLGIRSLSDGARAAFGLRRYMKQINPDIVQGWMYHGNLAALYCHRAANPETKLFWNIRHSLSSLQHERWMTRGVVRVGAAYSSRPSVIVFNSFASVLQHQVNGYDLSRHKVIPNGFDTELFKPSEEWRVKTRRQLGIPVDATVIGTAARFHRMKDYPTTIAAMHHYWREFPRTYFLLIGRDVDANNPLFTELARDHRVILTGEQKDLHRLMNAMDLFSLASAWGEAFPNVLGEAMACGVPCVATAVGDSAHIVGITGDIIPVHNAMALSSSWRHMITRRDLNDLRLAARNRIVQLYSIGAVVKQYEQMYADVGCASARSHGKPNLLI